MHILNTKTGTIHIKGKCRYSNPKVTDYGYKFFKSENDAVKFTNYPLTFCSRCYNNKFRKRNNTTLIECPFCNSYIPANAVQCTKCGKKIQAEKTRTLTLYRKRNSGGSASSIDVQLDGKCIGTLNNGGTLTVEISENEHKLQPSFEGRSQILALVHTGKTTYIPAGNTPLSYELKFIQGGTLCR